MLPQAFLFVEKSANLVLNCALRSQNHSQVQIFIARPAKFTHLICVSSLIWLSEAIKWKLLMPHLEFWQWTIKPLPASLITPNKLENNPLPHHQNWVVTVFYHQIWNEMLPCLRATHCLFWYKVWFLQGGAKHCVKLEFPWPTALICYSLIRCLHLFCIYCRSS